MNYANKRIKILSKEHLDHVIKVTGMETDKDNKRIIEERIHREVNVCFDQGFDNHKECWSYDYDILEQSTLDSFEEIFIPLPDPQRTINDIKGRLNLDHLTDDELVEHLCGDRGKEWDGVEPLRVGHVVRFDKTIMMISLMDEKIAVGFVDGEIDVYLLGSLKPVKSKANLLVEEYEKQKTTTFFDVCDYTQWLIDHDKLQS
jgi:hypothetical protein